VRSDVSTRQPDEELVEALAEFLVNNYSRLYGQELARDSFSSSKAEISPESITHSQCNTQQST